MKDYTWTLFCKYTLIQLQVFPRTQQSTIQFPVCLSVCVRLCVCIMCTWYAACTAHLSPLVYTGLLRSVPLSHRGTDTLACTYTRANKQTHTHWDAASTAVNGEHIAIGGASACTCVFVCVPVSYLCEDQSERLTLVVRTFLDMRTFRPGRRFGSHVQWLFDLSHGRGKGFKSDCD